jgi:hypothetical protein
MIYIGANLSEAFAETVLSYQLADGRLKAIIKEWLLLRTVPLKELSTNNSGWRLSELKHQFQADTGLYCFNGTMLGCILEIGGKARKVKGYLPYIKTNLKLNKSRRHNSRYLYRQEQTELVDSKRIYSALKHYTTKFQCNVFKEHFGDGANTNSNMVDSWYRLQELGVNIKRGVITVQFDIPDKYLTEAPVPSFIEPWIPTPFPLP